MPDFSLLGQGQQAEAAGSNTAVSRGTSITAGTVNTKGTYTQLIASTTFRSTAMLVMWDDPAVAVDYLIDVAVGAAASEVVIAPNLFFSSGATGTISYGAYYLLNIGIPAGSRLSARSQASTASSVSRISIVLFGKSLFASSPLNVVTAYGVNTATSGAVSIDPGGTANTKGAYSQIVASTTAPIRELYLAIGNQKNATRASASWLVDIAVGGAGSEQIIFPNLALNCSTSPDVLTPQVYGPLPAGIVTGTRLAVRAQSDLITAATRIFDAAIFGVC